MPRHARRHIPGGLVHVIVRFVNHEIRLVGPEERAALLDRLSTALSRSDWTLHAYAMMGSHFHLAMTAGNAPPQRFLKSLLVSLARYLNRAHRRFGPVVGERATTVWMAHERMTALVAYIHNNPVRAGCVSSASESDWTSHRAWTGLAPAPPWLDVDAGLGACGLSSKLEERLEFDAIVRSRAGDARDESLSGRTSRANRVDVRATTALPLELSSPRLVEIAADVSPRTASDSRETEHDLRHVGPLWVAPRWDGDLGELVASAARLCGCAVEEVRSRAARRRAVRARRIVMVAGVWLLRRRVNELAAALTISDGSASRLLRRGRTVLATARRVETGLRTDPRATSAQPS